MLRGDGRRNRSGLDAVSDDNKRTKLGEVGRSIPARAT